MQFQDSELWRVQLSTGEIRTMTLDALDAAFDEGLIDARTPVLPPGAASWTTLGIVAGLEDEPREPEQVESLSPLAIAAPSAEPTQTPAAHGELADGGELDLDELALRPRRGPALGLLTAAAAFAGVAAIVLTAGQLSGRGEVVPPVDLASGREAPPPAMALPAPAAPAASAGVGTAEPSAPTTAGGERLTEAQRQKLLEADQARADKAAGDKASRTRSTKRAPKKRRPAKERGPFIEGGDRFDPLNGAL